MASLYQRSSDGRWIAKVYVDGRPRHITGTDREDVKARTEALYPRLAEPVLSATERRFWSKVLRGPNCWLWEGARKERGYGLFRVDSNFVAQAARFSYELENGPVPDELEIDHLCHNPWCVNPAHLEAVTPEVNRERRIIQFRGWAPSVKT